MSKEIVLITPGQPTVNPRLVKEAAALVDAGYDVSVIYNFYVAWADKFDEELFQKYPQIKWIRVGGHPKSQPILYFFTRARKKFYSILFKIFENRFFLTEKCVIRAFPELLNKALSIKADLYIAHNLGALPAAVLAAKKRNSKVGFDAEDFHRGENKSNSKYFIEKNTKFLENKYIPEVNYFTAASLLIAAAYRHLFSGLDPVVIRNVFSSGLTSARVNYSKISDPLKLFWFSQNVGQHRGIEDVILALGKIKNENIQLFLLGNCFEKNRAYFIQMAKDNGLAISQLQFIRPVSIERILLTASNCDIGLCTEVSSDESMELRLTNKIFTYILAGNALIASDTQAQKELLQQHPKLGKIYERGNIESLSEVIKYFYDNRDTLNGCKQASFDLGKMELNWEIEQQKFLDLVKAQLV
jgi:glycosyltransferase involved in cell wall biosynthesis